MKMRGLAFFEIESSYAFDRAKFFGELVFK